MRIGSQGFLQIGITVIPDGDETDVVSWGVDS
jgi:hypothetical protein